MEQEVMKAIPRASRIKWVVAFVGIGIVMTWAWKAIVGPELRVYLSVRDPVEAFRRFQWVMFGIGASLVPFAVYIALFAAWIIRSRQFPYPGAIVWRDTRIVRGTRALVHGWTMAFLAALLLGMAIYAAYIPAVLAKHQRSISTRTIPAPSDQPVD